MRQSLAVNKRIRYVLFIIAGLISLLTIRVAWIQFVDGKQMLAAKQAQRWDTRTVDSPRGIIYDRNGRELAISTPRKSLYADLGEIPKQEREETARLLAPILNMSVSDLLERLQVDSQFVWIQRKLEPDISDKIITLLDQKRLSGIHFVEESKRLYPNGRLAAHVLGFVGTDNIGLEGIELSYDKHIRGESVKPQGKTETQGVSVFQSSSSIAAPRPGANLYLTIDAGIQLIVENSLDKLLAEKRAKTATVIIMHPRTGEILAMASRPDYDPNQFARYSTDSWKNRAISVVYEPGSTFQALVAAAVLQEGVVSPDEVFTDSGQIAIDGITIKNWDDKGRGAIPFSDVIKDSINTGFVMAGQKSGAVKLMQYMRQFGFGRSTDLCLPGEEEGLLFDAENMRTADLARMSIGQGIAVTPIQLVTAIAAIANDGVLLKPYIVRELRNCDGSTLSQSATEPVRQVISTQTAKTLTAILEQVVSEGDGKQAAVKGYRFAGKTGIAEKLKLSGSGYENGHYIASFAGFGPVDAPQLAALVVVDDPAEVPYGGQVAAPVFSEIMSQVMLYLTQQPASGDINKAGASRQD